MENGRLDMFFQVAPPVLALPDGIDRAKVDATRISRSIDLILFQQLLLISKGVVKLSDLFIAPQLVNFQSSGGFQWQNQP